VETSIPGCLTDLLTGIYYALVPAHGSRPELRHPGGRCAALGAGDHRRSRAAKEIKTTLGTFKTLRVQPTADAGPPAWSRTAATSGSGIITDDDRHLPVQMRARLFWGTITFRLTGNESK